MQPQTFDEIILSAVRSMLRWWAFIDGPSRHEVRRSGRVTLPVYKNVGRYYSILRNLGSGTDEFKETMLADMNAHFDRCRGLPIVERAALISEKAQELEKRFHTHGKPVSALSKLGWFYAPVGWTMYDSIAATSVGQSNITGFYRKLASAGLAVLCTELRQSGGFDDADQAERLIDFALMARAMPSPYGAISDRELQLAEHVRRPLSGFLERTLV